MSENKIYKELREVLEKMEKTIYDYECKKVGGKMPEVKDSGKRYINENGGQRDTSEGKPNFKYVPFEIISLINEYSSNQEMILFRVDITKECFCIAKTENYNTDLYYNRINLIIFSMIVLIGEGECYNGLKKFALFMEKCANKYSFENWKLLTSEADRERFKESLLRHSVQALFNQGDEFHREAVVFNAMCLLINFETEEESD